MTGRRVVFDIAHARSALPYVERIVRDAAEAYRCVQYCRTSLERRISHRERVTLIEQREEALRRLNLAIDECNDVGADLLNIRKGIVRFSAVIDERPVSLLWRLGEPIESAWQDLVDEAFCADYAALADASC